MKFTKVFQERFIRAFWDETFNVSVCEYCGKDGVDKVYKSYACHTRCENKLKKNGSYRHHFRYTYEFRQLNVLKRTYIILKDIINISFINSKGKYYEQLRKIKTLRKKER